MEIQISKEMQFRTELAGDIVVGRYRPWNAYLEYSKAPPSALIYRKQERFPINEIYHYSEEEPTSGEPTPYSHILPETYTYEELLDGSASDEMPDRLTTDGPPDMMKESMNFSWAPLNGVSQAQVFYEKDGISCKGVLFTYQNGSQRAVGQCRPPY